MNIGNNENDAALMLTLRMPFNFNKCYIMRKDKTVTGGKTKMPFRFYTSRIYRLKQDSLIKMCRICMV